MHSYNTIKIPLSDSITTFWLAGSIFVCKINVLWEVESRSLHQFHLPELLRYFSRKNLVLQLNSGLEKSHLLKYCWCLKLQVSVFSHFWAPGALVTKTSTLSRWVHGCVPSCVYGASSRMATDPLCWDEPWRFSSQTHYFLGVNPGGR